MKFLIAIQWEAYADIEVEAESLEKAVNQVELDSDELVLPEDWDLTEGSIGVNYRVTETLNLENKLNEEPQRRELEAKDFGIVGAQTTEQEEKAIEICDDEEMEARRHLDQLGEGYEQDSEDEDSEEEG